MNARPAETKPSRSSKPLYIVAPHVTSTSQTDFDYIAKIAQIAGRADVDVATYVGRSFEGKPAGSAADAIAYFDTSSKTIADKKKPGGESQGRRGPRWFSVLLGISRSYHVSNGVAAMIGLSFSPRSRDFIAGMARLLRTIARAGYWLIRFVLGLLRFAIDLPGALWKVIFGPPVSLEPFSRFGRQLGELLDRNDTEGATLVVVSRDLTDLDRLMDLEVLTDTLPATVEFVFLTDKWRDLPLDRTIDPDMLGARLATSALGPTLSVYADTEAGRDLLGKLLGRDIETAADLESTLAKSADKPPKESLAAKPIAAVIRPQWLLCGSNMVFANQIEYLAARGYYVMEIVVNDLFLGHDTPERITHHILSTNRGSKAHRTLVLNMKVGLLPWLRLLFRYGRKFFRSSIMMRAACLELVELPNSLETVLNRRPADLVVVNHCFNMNAAKKLFPDTPLVLESHDIQAKQSQLRSEMSGVPADRFDMDAALEDEFDLMRAATHVISLNEEETLYFSEDGGVENITTIHPYYVPPAHLRMNGHAVSKTMLPDSTDSESIAVAHAIDVLLIASNHAANVVSIRWFLDEVFLPYLADRPINVAIVGNIADAIDFRHPNLTFTGRVPNVEPYYAAAKVVALPVTTGAGIPIKTLEALAVGKPVVATSGALRGLSESGADDLPVFDDGKSFAAEITRLIADESERRERANTGATLAEKTYSRTEYFSRWDGVVAILPVVRPKT